ncbi:MAG: tetratricopeptide repeat protein [Candidatus Nanoarchaeia archaeon]
MKKFVLLFFYIVIGVSVRAFYLAQYSKSPIFDCPLGPDVQEYHARAMEILAGKILWEKPQIHAPLYPIFLSVLYKITSINHFWTRLIQSSLCFISSIPLLWVLLKGKFVNAKILAIFAFLLLVYPPAIYYECEYVSETLLLILIQLSLASLYFAEFAKNKKTVMLSYAVAGIFMGLSAITHPVSLIFCFLIFAYFAYKYFRDCYENYACQKNMEIRLDLILNEKVIAETIIFCIPVAIIALPVAAYNHSIGGTFGIQENAGFNFYLGNSEIADGTCKIRPGPDWDNCHSEAEQEAREKATSKDKIFISRSMKFIKQNPISWFCLVIKKALLAWNGCELVSGADYPSFRFFTTFQKAFSWTNYLLMGFSLCAFLILLKKKDDIRAFKFFILLYISFWLSQTIFVASGRYRFPSLPATTIFTAYFLCNWKNFFLERQKYFLTTIVISFAISFFPVRIDKEKELAEAKGVLAEAYLKKGQLIEAEEMLKYTISVLPPWTRYQNILGTIKMEQGNLDEAEAKFLSALEINSKDQDAIMNLALVASAKGDKEKSENYFKKALELAPKSPMLHFNYGLFLQNNGKNQEAIEHYKRCLSIDPSNKRALNNYGVIEMQLGNITEAEKYFESALRLSPSDKKTIMNLIVAKFALGKTHEAEKLKQRLKNE